MQSSRSDQQPAHIGVALVKRQRRAEDIRRAQAGRQAQRDASGYIPLASAGARQTHLTLCAPCYEREPVGHAADALPLARTNAAAALRVG